MALVLVQHDISKQIVEIDEAHLAHPVLGPHYKRVRVNEDGKVYVLQPGEVDAPADDSDVDAAELSNTEREADANAAAKREEGKK